MLLEVPADSAFVGEECNLREDLNDDLFGRLQIPNVLPPSQLLIGSEGDEDGDIARFYDFIVTVGNWRKPYVKRVNARVQRHRWKSAF